MNVRLFNNKLIILVTVCFFALTNANGQDTRKNRLSSSVWNAYTVDYNISETDDVFFELGGRFNGQTNAIARGGLFGKLASLQSLVGYQKELNEKWKAGFYQRLFLLPTRLDYHTRIFTGHIGKIGSLKFEKNLSFEYLSIGSDDNPATVENDIARLSIDFNFIKTVKVNTRELDLIFSYRSFWFKELNSSFEIYSGRFIDRSRLRVMLKYELLKKLNVEAFYIHNTDYFLISSGVDERLNNISSVFGIRIQMIFGKENGQKRLLIY